MNSFSGSQFSSNTMNLQDSQTLVLLPMQDLEKLLNGIREIKDLIKDSKEDSFMNRWVESAEARKQLGVSPRTWQKWRDERKLPFVQFGRKIYVKQADIEAFLKSNYIVSES